MQASEFKGEPIALGLDVPLGQLKMLFQQQGHSRQRVYPD